ncbi:DUF4235 domain-containing protein [Kushneria phosphatilytica]|uniref:DUF4235 domain-containing protein n=1 Tax=Kushneria phosphatilytica TaxID=657387 RepID=A0A1S1NT34_9GAMM|nr:DUF4235 domain-containing protein [Kushneria phosphatilytica]OHV08631.1 hypothetical protein BH688_11310 [Kushneria phosphatilytica]QEL12338.1 DUF4235 domain-containing protein [Kushneria phosphatilytica]
MKPQTVWTLFGTATALTTGVLVRQTMKRTSRRYGFEPPLNPDDPDVRWRDALAWGACSGMLVGMARILGWRMGSEAMKRARRHPKGQRVLSRFED